MDKRRNTYFRFLNNIFSILIVVISLNATLFAANVYIRVRDSDCSKTKLSIKLEGLQNLPASINLSIRNSKTSNTAVGTFNLSLENGEYIWIGLIPISDYRAVITFPDLKIPLEEGFNNKKILLQFFDKQSRVLQIRNGKNKKPSSETMLPPDPLEDIPLGEFSSQIGIIHLLLFNKDNKLADQYLGNPISTWNSSVPTGTYKLVEVLYFKEESNCTIKK